MDTKKQKNNTRGGKRDGAGRPKKNQPKKIITIRISKNISDNIELHAKILKTSISKYIKDILIEYENQYYYDNTSTEVQNFDLSKKK